MSKFQGAQPNIEEQKGRSFTVPGKEGVWHGKELEAKSDPLIDAGTGKPYILRCFEFAINPEIKVTPTKQDLFNYHWKQIQVMLWGDGLRHREDTPPRVVVDSAKKKYSIFILAEPRLNQSVFDKPKTVQDLLKK